MTSLLLGALEGTLDAEQQARLAAHLADCASCRQTLAAHGEVRQALGQLVWPPVSAGFAARVRQRVAPKPTWLDLTNWRSWTLRLAPVAALLFLFAWWPAPGETGATSSLEALLHAWTETQIGETQQRLLDPAADIGVLVAPEESR